MSNKLDDIRLVRRDLGNLLFHFTRRKVQLDDSFTGEKSGENKSAFSVLGEILKGGKLKGGTGYIKGSHRCVCFTESPISELASLFYLNQSMKQSGRYEPYGIAVPKDWLFSQGGRPVIYQHEAEYDQLPEPMKFRHVTYIPPNTDFTWEREWRIKKDELTLDLNQTLVVVPSALEATALNHIHSDDVEGKGVGGRTFQKPHWMIVSLDLFGLKGVGSNK